MADEVDYESDTVMAMEEEEEDVPAHHRRVELASSSSAASAASRRAVKGRGRGTAAMDSERYPAHTGVFDKLRDRDDADRSSARTSSSVASARRRESFAPQKSVEGWILFVTGVHEEAQEEQLLDAFADDAPVKNLHMNLDRRSGFVKGYALLEFADYDAAKDAIDRMDGQEILGKTIHVDWAFRKEPIEETRRDSRSRPSRR